MSRLGLVTFHIFAVKDHGGRNETVAVGVFSGMRDELKRDLCCRPGRRTWWNSFCRSFDKQIAHERQMSVPTVRTHLYRLFTRWRRGSMRAHRTCTGVFGRVPDAGCPRATRHDGYAAAETTVSCLPAVI
jgi:hypothetical protein